MPALLDIRRRIRSVRNTQQITKAMKMVSAAKLRRAQESMFAARPYARRMMEVLNSLATRANPELHPLLVIRPARHTLLIVITADKGLCGGFNSNIIRAAARFIDEHHQIDLKLGLIGRKGRDFFKRRHMPVRFEHTGVFQPLRYAAAQAIAKDVIAGYCAEQLDQVYLAFNEFKSVIQQRIVIERLLPIERYSLNPKSSPVDYLYEPEPASIFAELLPKHIEMQIWRALLESAAAEHGARMAAMDAASNNAADVIDRLTLYMNKVRQASITREIIEVVSGAGAPV
ncbi:MAG: ATP synthase F1 subunit gamma [Vicinamibacteria bacterium]|nr:ATP synthase F1 subunit gamma [Vicinamibacteria bacterium]